MNLFNALKNALDRHELFLTYQPIFDLCTQQMTGMEALIRWEHPTLGLISPNIFIPLAEKNGLIHEMGIWVLKTACEQAKIWQIGSYNNLTIAINISPHQLFQQNFPEIITKILYKTQLSPNILLFELTETALIPNLNISRFESTASTMSTHLSSSENVLKQIHEIGIKISIDDFGTGYSSLMYLSRLPITSFKIDKSFVQKMAVSHNDAVIISALIRLGKDLGLTVIAEGIEKKTQLKWLIEQNCPQGQGNYLSEPLNVDEMTRFMNKMTRY